MNPTQKDELEDNSPGARAFCRKGHDKKCSTPGSCYCHCHRKKPPKLESDLGFRIQNLITDYIVASGDPLADAAEAIKSLIEYEKQKAVEGILTKVEDWAHSNSDMGGDMPYGELLEYLTELTNTPSNTKGDIDNDK